MSYILVHSHLYIAEGQTSTYALAVLVCLKAVVSTKPLQSSKECTLGLLYVRSATFWARNAPRDAPRMWTCWAEIMHKHTQFQMYNANNSKCIRQHCADHTSFTTWSTIMRQTSMFRPVRESRWLHSIKATLVCNDRFQVILTAYKSLRQSIWTTCKIVNQSPTYIHVHVYLYN